MKNIPYIPHGKLKGLIEEFFESVKKNPPKDIHFGFWSPQEWLEYFTVWMNETGHFVLAIPGFKPEKEE